MLDFKFNFLSGYIFHISKEEAVRIYRNYIQKKESILKLSTKYNWVGMAWAIPNIHYNNLSLPRVRQCIQHSPSLNSQAERYPRIYNENLLFRHDGKKNIGKLSCCTLTVRNCLQQKGQGQAL
jgi:hypothetical protein